LLSDSLLLVFALGLPPFVVAVAVAGGFAREPNVERVLLLVNASLLGIRLVLLWALAGSYERPGITFWLSPLADPLAVWRVLWSSLRRPREWRGRVYR